MGNGLHQRLSESEGKLRRGGSRRGRVETPNSESFYSLAFRSLALSDRPIHIAAAQHARASAHERASCALRVSASDDRADKRGGRRRGDTRRRGTASGNSQRPGR